MEKEHQFSSSFIGAVHRLDSVPTIESYIRGLSHLEHENSITKKEREVLEFQYYSVDHKTYASEMATFFNYTHVAPINGIYGRLGNKLARAMGRIPSPREGGGYRGWITLSQGWSDGKFYWQMYENLAVALKELGWVDEMPLYSDEAPEQFMEGARTRVLVNRYERNPLARRRCLQHHGWNCIVCNLNFEQVYGEIGIGFIHVHHVVPISHFGEEYELDPIKHLVPVCPNCHAMLHRRNPPFEVEELREVIT